MASLLHELGQAEVNVGYEALRSIIAEILAIAFSGMVWMLEFLKASDERHF